LAAAAAAERVTAWDEFLRALPRGSAMAALAMSNCDRRAAAAQVEFESKL